MSQCLLSLIKESISLSIDTHLNTSSLIVSLVNLSSLALLDRFFFNENEMIRYIRDF
jgi:hypothetical protein